MDSAMVELLSQRKKETQDRLSSTCQGPPLALSGIREAYDFNPGRAHAGFIGLELIEPPGVAVDGENADVCRALRCCDEKPVGRIDLEAAGDLARWHSMRLRNPA